MRVFTGRVKREEDEVRRGNGPGERGNRDLKECWKREAIGRIKNTDYKMQSQRSLYARECARMRARARARVCAFYFYFLFLYFLRFFSLLFRLSMRARARYSRTLLLLYLLGVWTDAEKAHIKLSRWFIVCIARRRHVMRASVRIYGRRCSQAQDRWNMKALFLLQKDVSAHGRQKIWHHLPPGRWVRAFVRDDPWITASKDLRERESNVLRFFEAILLLSLHRSRRNLFANKIEHRRWR